MKEAQATAIMVAIVVFIFMLMLASVSKVAYNAGYERGFEACIEENNLNERYEK